MGRNILRQLKYIALTILHTVSASRLKRTLEPFALTEQQDHVNDYDKAIHSVMIVPYVLVLDLVHRIINARKESVNTNLSAVDLCCGPGHFTRLLAKNFSCRQVIGVDLSEPMLQKAALNAKKENRSELTYLKSDVSSLKEIESNSMDIVSFMDGAHHMNSVNDITKILIEADRVAKADGLIILLDPVRPKTNLLFRLYHRIAGKAYVDLGLNHFNKDFYDSLLASFSLSELFSAIPTSTDRTWIQLVPFGFPAFQIVIGMPKGQTQVFAGPGLSAFTISELVPPEAKGDWFMLSNSFRLARKKIINSFKLC